MERDWLRNLLASDLRKGIFSFFFSSYFYISKLASDPILADFHQPGNSLPPRSLVSLMEEGLEAGLEVWMIFCAPNKVEQLSFPERCSHRVAVSPCMLHHGQSFPRIFPSHTSRSEDQNSYRTEILTPTAFKITVHFSNL